MNKLLAVLVLVSGAALADEAPKRAKLVGVILGSGQALLWDDEKGEYALRKAGEEIDGARIVAVDADHLVIDRNGTPERLDLQAAPSAKVKGKVKRMPAMIVGTNDAEPLGAIAARGTEETPAPPAAPVAPAPPAAPTAPAAVAPQAAPALPAPVAVAPQPAPALPPPAAVAPQAAPALPAPAAVAPQAAPVLPAPVAVAPPAAPVLPAPAAVAPAPAPAPVVPMIATPPAAPAPPRAPVTVQGPPPSPDSPVVVIPRPVLERELSDPRLLGNQVQLVPGPRGGFRLTSIAPGSFCDRVGLRAGDIVWRVDGRILNNVEDALHAIAWVRIADRFTVDLMRDGRPMAYRYVITGPATASR